MECIRALISFHVKRILQWTKTQLGVQYIMQHAINRRWDVEVIAVDLLINSELMLYAGDDDNDDAIHITWCPDAVYHDNLTLLRNFALSYHGKINCTNKWLLLVVPSNWALKSEWWIFTHKSSVLNLLIFYTLTLPYTIVFTIRAVYKILYTMTSCTECLLVY